MFSDLLRLSACELARLIHRRKVSCRDVVETHLGRIQDENSRINAVVQLNADGAVRSVTAADDALSQGREPGPLQGVPFTVKDRIEMEGLPRAAGMEEASRKMSRSMVSSPFCA